VNEGWPRRSFGAAFRVEGNPMHSFKTLLVALPAVWFAAGLTLAQEKGGNPEAAKLKNPIARSAESIQAGQDVYMKYCRGCHSRDAAGGPPAEAGEEPASNLIDEQWNHGSTDGEIFQVIKEGVPPALVMEPFRYRLAETDIWHVVNYLRSLAVKK
jgi:mono/diheme cytochrome c family protein